MELLAVTLLFGTITALLTAAGLRIWHPQIAPRIRVQTAAGGDDPFDADAVAIPPSLAEKVGKMLPPSPRNADAMVRRLIRAGFWRPGALTSVYGFKASLGLAVPLAAALAAARLQMAAHEKLLLAEVLVAAGFFLPNAAIEWRAWRRRKRILLSLADALDLMVMCMSAGLAPDKAMVETARGLEHAHPDLAQELALVNLEIRAGKDRTEALRDLGLRTGMRELRDVAMILIQSDRIRTSVAASLRSYAEHLRAMTALYVSEQTGKLGVKLTLPIFFCTLPSVIVIMVGPQVIHIWRDLLPMLRFVNVGM